MFERYRANKELKYLYEAWYEEVKDFKLLNSDSFTNPSYIGIPKNWFKSEHRILIVGEETFGEDGNGKECGLKPGDIEKLQEYNLKKFIKSMTPSDRLENQFWPRARRVAQLGWPCAWTFLDKVGKKYVRRSRLEDKDRDLLHSVKTRVLAEEIQILEPTVVFFFGWIGTALKTELPEFYNMLYPGGDGDDHLWKNTFVSFHNSYMMYLFTYNPYSPYWRKKPKTYEDDIIARVADFTNVGMIRSSIFMNQDDDEDVDDSVYEELDTQSNIVTKVAASYALGRVASKVMDEVGIGLPNRNPNTDRYMEAQRSAKAAGNLSQRDKRESKQQVKLSNGKGAYLYTLPNGNQQLVDVSGKMIARYDALSNKTTEGNIKEIGKGNLISTFLL